MRNPRVSLFADVIEDVERIQQDLRPHLTAVRQLLRDDPTMAANSAEYRRAQHTYNQVSEGLHYLAHAFHAMSDLMVDFAAPAPREVRARPYVYQQAVLSTQIPIHASISVETTHTRPAAQPSAPTGPAAAPPQASTTQTTPAATAATDASIYPNLMPRAPPPPPPPPPPRAANPPTTTAPSPAYLRSAVNFGRRAAAPNGNPPNPNPRLPMMAMMGGPHPFGRLPLAMAGTAASGSGGWTPVTLAGSVAPMVFMEVRSSNGNGQSDDHPSPGSASSPGSSPSEFDDFLPCHSRHLARASRAPNAASRQRTAPTISVGSRTAAGGQVPRPTRPSATVPVPITVADFVNEMLRQADADMGAGPVPGGNRQAPTGQQQPSGASGAAGSETVNTAMFSNLLQGVMQEMAGVVSGQQTGTTVANFLRTIPDFAYSPGEGFIFDLFMALAEHLTFRDLVSLFNGVPQVLNPLRDQLRTFARERILNSGDFSEANVRRATMRLVNESLPLLQSAAVSLFCFY